jgi:hypothetical protein
MAKTPMLSTERDLALFSSLPQGDLDPLEIITSLMEQAPPECAPKAGVKCGDYSCPCPETAILISGCGPHQLSVDTGSGSVLTLALIEVLQSFKAAHPDQDISNR